MSHKNFFQTFVNDGVIFSTSPRGYGTSVTVRLLNDVVSLTVIISASLRFEFSLHQQGIDDGKWRKANLRVNKQEIMFQLDDDVVR